MSEGGTWRAPRRRGRTWIPSLLLVALLVSPVAAEDPLVRLSVWVPPERHAEFAADFEQRILPIVEGAGLRLADVDDRPTLIDSVFARRFFVPTIEGFGPLNVGVLDSLEALRADLGRVYAGGDSLRITLHPYRAELGPGSSRELGPGALRGEWRTFTKADGLPSIQVQQLAVTEGGTIWGTALHSDEEIFRIEGDSLHAFTEADGFLSIGWRPTALGAETWWAADSRWGTGLVVRQVAEHLEYYSLADGLGHAVSIEAGQSRLWLVTDGRVLSWASDRFREHEALRRHGARQLAQDQGGEQLWLCTDAGLVRVATDSVDISDAGHLVAGDELGWPEERACGPMVAGEYGTLWVGLHTSEDFLGNNVIFSWDGSTSRRYDSPRVTDLLSDRQGRIWATTWGSLRRLATDRFRDFTQNDGLPHTQFGDIVEDDRSRIWVATHGGLSRYEGDRLRSFPSDEAHLWGSAISIGEDRHGRVWFGSWAGVSYYEEGVGFRTNEQLSTLRHFWEIKPDHRGDLWFAGQTLGRLEGDRIVEVIPEGRRLFLAFAVEPDGTIWTGGQAVEGEKTLFRLKGARLDSFGVEDGLPSGSTAALATDPAGGLWIGMWNGELAHYEDGLFENVLLPDVPEGAGFTGLLADADGSLWRTWAGQLCNVGDEIRCYGEADGLDLDQAFHLIRDQRGILWVSGWGDGIRLFDGTLVQPFTFQDGLINDGVQETFQDSRGTIWVATEGGITRFRYPDPLIPPPIHAEVTNLDAVSEHGRIVIDSEPGDLTIECRSGLHDAAHRIIYYHRLAGVDDGWQATREPTITYRELAPGEYRFEVRAVDRYLVYSEEPATIDVTVRRPWGLIALRGGLALSLIGLVAASSYGYRRRRDQRQLERSMMQELEEELDEARRLQMGLMPEAPPAVAGLDVAGQCRTANHVGGDLYKYYPAPHGLTIGLADVTGHAMQAAIPVVLFSGVLEKQMEFPGDLRSRFAGLNTSLCRALDKHKFVCFTMAEIDTSSMRMQLASCGNPYALHYRDGQVTEIEVDGYPLGVRPDVEYRVAAGELRAGDYIVLYSDGIPETVDADEQMYGFDRVLDAVRRGCEQGLSAQALVQSTMEGARQHAGTAAQADDMTCVVVRLDGPTSSTSARH